MYKVNLFNLGYCLQDVFNTIEDANKAGNKTGYCFKVEHI